METSLRVTQGPRQRPFAPMNYLIETEVRCPWCGEVYPTTVDTSQGDHTTIEDCAVCCRPIELTVACEPGDLRFVEAARA